MTTATHTPTPEIALRAANRLNDRAVVIDGKPYSYATVAARVNAHDRLVAALREILAYEDDAPPVGSRGAEIYANARALLAELDKGE